MVSFLAQQLDLFFLTLKMWIILNLKIFISKGFILIFLQLYQKKNYPKIPEIKLPNIQKAKDLIHTIENHNIGIAPGAGDPIRCWDFENYLLVAKLLKKKGYNIYFFLGPNEKQFLRKCEAEGFDCPEWSNGELISKEIVFTMNLAKKMSLLLCNDGGTAWMFEFAGIKTLKIFGVTDEVKFARPGFCKTIQVKDYGFNDIKDFPVNTYMEILFNFIQKN